MLGEIDPAYVVGDEKYAPLSYYLKKRLYPKCTLPEDQRKRFQETRHLITARNLFLFNELKTVLRFFQQINIEVILLKGVMMQFLYPAGLRPFTDMDLLIKREKLNCVQEILSKLGYVRRAPRFHSGFVDFAGEVNYVKEDILPVMIEPHWLLAPAYPYGAKICMNRLWRRSATVDFLGVETRILAPEDSLLHFCLHFFKHHHSGCHSVCDMTEILYRYEDKIDWELFLANVFNSELALPVNFSLQRAARLFQAPVPDWVSEKFLSYQPARREHRVYQALCRPRQKNLSVLPVLVQFLSMPFHLKLRYGWRKLFPDKKFIRKRYPELTSSSLILCYLYRIFSICLKILIVLVRGLAKA
jgi:hypothetical protein